MAGNIGVASASMADMTPPEDRTKGMGMLGAAFGVGFVIGPVIGGFSANWNMAESFPDTSFLHPFSFCAALAFLLSLVSVVLNVALFQESLDSKKEGEWVTNPLGLQAELKRGGFLRVVYVNFFYVLVFAGFEFILTFFYKLDFGLSPSEIGLVFLYIGVLIAVGQGGLVRKLAPLLGEKKLGLMGILLQPLPLLFLAYTAPSVGLSLLCLFPIAIGASFTHPALAGLASLLSPPDRQGLAMGVFRAIGSLARALGPMSAAYVYWTFGIEAVSTAISVLMFAIALSALGLKQKEG